MAASREVRNLGTSLDAAVDCGVGRVIFTVLSSMERPCLTRTVNGPGGQKIKTWICRDKRKGSGCKGRNVKEEELLKYGDVARLVVKDDGIEVQ